MPDREILGVEFAVFFPQNLLVFAKGHGTDRSARLGSNVLRALRSVTGWKAVLVYPRKSAHSPTRRTPMLFETPPLCRERMRLGMSGCPIPLG